MRANRTRSKEKKHQNVHRLLLDTDQFHLLFEASLTHEMLESIHDQPRAVAIKHVQPRRRWPHPGLEIVNRDRDVLCVALVENPNFSVLRGKWNAVPIVVKQDPLLM